MKRRFKTVGIFASVIIAVFIAALWAADAESVVKTPDPVVKAQEGAVTAPGDEVQMQGGPANMRRGMAKERRKLVKAQRSAEIPLDGAKIIRIDTHVGRVEINAAAGNDVVRASGTASALKKESLDGIRLTASREKDAILIRAETPGEVPRVRVYIPDPTVLTGRGGKKNKDLPEEPDVFLDLSVTVPPNIPLAVNTVWGEVIVNGTSTLALTVNRGNVMIKDLTGDLRLSVDSGEIKVIGVTGDVDVTKGDGDMIIKTVGGSVLVRQNPFGEVWIIDVKKDVRIVSDGLGDIVVETVGGDLIVEDDEGGGIRREGIQGKVLVPKGGPPKNVREKKQKRKEAHQKKTEAQETLPEKTDGEKKP